jgi:hypothetical protein
MADADIPSTRSVESGPGPAHVLALGLPCPSCQGAMQVHTLACTHCDVRVSGRFEANEFALLSPEHLQLLRVFVLCEGRIRDMEKALGVSYPTVKNRLAALRARLGLEGNVRASDDTVMPAEAQAPDPEQAALAVLDALERGELATNEAVLALRGIRGGEGEG